MSWPIPERPRRFPDSTICEIVLVKEYEQIKLVTVFQTLMGVMFRHVTN